MPTEEFHREMVINLNRQKAWEVLLDVETVAGWVGLIGEVREIAPLARYRAVLSDRVGPFRLRADLDINIKGVEEASKVVLRAEGEDRQVRSRIKVDMTLLLSDTQADTTAVRIEGRYQVTGRVATLGASLIRHKADAILNDFCTQAARAA